MKKRLFKYYPEDFGQLTVKVLHMDLDFDIYNNHARVKSALRVKTLKPIKKLELNANNLEIHQVYSKEPLTYNYDKDNNKIIITFTKQIPKNKTITLNTETTCKPTKNILEGMYYDETPKGAPPTIISQCQQWGFQRIVPCIDDMTAKCTYITKITADSRYTNIITNGDLKSKRTKDNRTTVIYHNTITPMSTYLFFIGCGTYATFKRKLQYADGSTFMLELLVPPKSSKKIAQHALAVMHDSIQWIHLFTGPNRYKNYDTSLKIWNLIKERESAKGKERNKIQLQISKLAKPLKLGYKYTGTVYREIGMQNSDFGGMENVGNTTITTNRIMPFNDMSDGSFEYMIMVKVHEFYHNLNGSEVTGRSPFEIWLNEAVTVHIEREFSAFLSGEDYCRLGDVLTLLAPGSGTLALDSGIASMPIEPDGFNDCNELITSVTYVKAPEFVRMIQTLMTDKFFVKGLDKYHRTYKHSNASRKQWIESMESIKKQDFTKMASVWLKETGYPIVSIKNSYDSKRKIHVIKVNQTNAKKGKEWQFPFSVALFDEDGRILAERTERIDFRNQEITFERMPKPAFVSVNRGYSFYGKVLNYQRREQLLLQVRKDNDIVNRYMAFYQLWDEEKTALLKGKKQVDPELIELYHELLTDKNLMATVSTAILAIFASVEDQKFSHHYDKLYNIKKKINKAIASKYKNELVSLYKTYSKKRSVGNYLEKELQNIKWRQVKNTCLALLATLDTSDIHKIIKQQLLKPSSASDKITALKLYLDSSAKDRLKILKQQEAIAKKNLVSWESFLYVVGGNDSENYLDLIRKIEKSPSFRIEQANDQRGLYLSFAHNKKKSLLTKEGREFLKNTILKLAPINEYTTGHLLKVLGHVDKVENKHQTALKKMMKDILKKLDQKKTPSVYNTLARILKGLN